ncbi:diacylglycerol/lipid kinase family protein [Prosthecomicrobium sp. N25]|uniref:diacylglycerol/lipid kinase family protein n=1 Tax=Prosthecomicrobium sp. N25 TaxID=3129254 RepID=UPI0030777AA4
MAPPPADQPAARATVPSSGEAASRRMAVLVNPEAGTARTWDPAALETRIREALAPIGTVVLFEAVQGAGLATAVERVFDDAAVDLVVVGGGDGTASTAASHAIRTGKPVAVLPLGTFNLFARLNGFTPTLDGTLDSLATASVEAIDVGRIGDRWFLHHVTIGAHPRIIRLREAHDYGSRWGKMLAGARAFVSALSDPPQVRLAIHADRERLSGAFSNVAVTVNELAETPAVAPVPADPQGGRLAVYATRSRRATDFLMFTLLALAGRWRSNPWNGFARARRVSIMAHRPVLRLSIDGEAVDWSLPLEVEIVPGALNVLRPSKSA